MLSQLPNRHSRRRSTTGLLLLAGLIASVYALATTGAGNTVAQAQQPANNDRVKIIAAPPPPPPIYGARELADAELSLLDAETVLSYWNDQEEKWNSVLATMDGQPGSEREAAFARQALSNALRAQSTKIDAGLQRERAAKRIDAMRAKNVEVQGGVH
jgi:hypothetical protein